jgi:hypothetical protein
LYTIQQRATETGRIVPEQTLLDAMEEVPRSVESLTPLVDYAVEIRNNPNEALQLIKPEQSTWDSFRQQWWQEAAYVSKKSQSLLLQKSKQIERHLVDALET